MFKGKPPNEVKGTQKYVFVVTGEKMVAYILLILRQINTNSDVCALKPLLSNTLWRQPSCPAATNGG